MEMTTGRKCSRPDTEEHCFSRKRKQRDKSSEVRGAPPSPLTYAKTAKIRGGGTPHAKISTSLSFGGQQLNDSLGKNQVLELQISKAARVLNSGLRK